MSKASVYITSGTMPAGDYYVGDPCYAVPGDRWMEWLEAGNYDSSASRWVIFAELDGYPVLGCATAHGDGMYDGDDGKRYLVDAGLIGLVPVEVALPGDTPEGMGMVRVRFKSDFTFENDEGVIRLGHITIDTKEDEDDGWF